MGRLKFYLPQKLVVSFVNNIKPANFIETGVTDLQTCLWATNYFKNVYGFTSNENSNLPCKDNIKIFGNKELNEQINKLEGVSIFFINSLPVEKDNKSPITIREELKAISTTTDPVIIINNACYLGGKIPYADRHDNWPDMQEIFTLCGSIFPESYFTIIDDNIVCVPNKWQNIVSAFWAETFEERFYEPDPEPRKRTLTERIISRTKREIRKRTAKKEAVAYNIRESQWFENELRSFYHAHKWLQEKQFKTIIDIGANVGQFGKKIRQYYPDAHLYSFEPIPFVCDELKLNFKDDPNFTAINAGLGDSDGKTKFHLNLFSDSSSMLEIGELHKKNFPYTKDEIEIEVEIKKLDNCFKPEQLVKPYLVKIDVQGFEEQVINGGTEVIRNADMIITESSYKELYKGQSLFDVLYDKLKDMGFDFAGNLEQMESAFTGEPLQGDAIFIKRK